ncbi:ComEC/Rec2 family competence protein [Moraxella osloensis]|uniref:ComEC/Rec2 family competence protein n=1 Tax=Faucicola osloensis TaxID=34062 RepID=UPI0020048C3C|nr:ComEC/Rec2 family competence protein [Moraxella osloensis]MCK6052029.1 ComEC/Rec2 family competence protein [Moraxella osloensis]
MIWLITVASLLGFVVVNTLANQPLMTGSALTSYEIASYDAKIWQMLSVALLIALLINLGLYHGCKRKQLKRASPNPAFAYRFTLPLLASFIFLLTLMLSASYGLYHYKRYENALLPSALTVEAIVEAHQISDTLSQMRPLPNDNALIGNGFIKQILQVRIDKDGDADASSSTPQLPLTALISANIKDNPDWEATLSQLRPGMQLNVKLQLEPIAKPKPTSLPSNAKPLRLGFDEAQWLRQRGVQAKGVIIGIEKTSLREFNPSHVTDRMVIAIEKLRWQLRQKILANLHTTLLKQSTRIANAKNDIAQPVLKSSGETSTQSSGQSAIQSHAILLGLLTGDKSLMDSDLKNRYQVTGISHLLAISGPHVLMLAAIVSVFVVWLIKWFAPQLLVKLPSSLLVLWVSVVMAGFYALLVGFEIPAQRTFWMLLLLTLSKQLLVNFSAYRLLAWVALGMIWLEPTAVGQAGFWLSFVAVVLLLKFSETIGTVSAAEIKDVSQLLAPTARSDVLSSFVKIISHQFKALLKLQIWLFVWMLPIVVWFFGKVSVIGILVNLLAVPFLGLVVVPLDMLAGVVSWLPVIGDWLSQIIWSMLTTLLNVFHFLLNQLIDTGVAKQSFFVLSQTQLALCLFIALLGLLKGLLPRMLMLPLAILLILLPLQQRSLSNNKPTLAVGDNPKLVISLLKKGDDSWLILSDNQIKAAQADKPNFLKSKQAISNVAADEEISSLLNRDIYPLLANQQVHRLTGVISQTPSVRVNELVQQLATHVPVKAYWLAGYDAEHSRLDVTDKAVATSFRAITPRSCQTAQRWQQDGLEVTAVSGWHLDLALTDEQKLATQTCYIHIRFKPPTSKPYDVLMLAGNSDIPMQMTEKLCTVSATHLLIQPYTLSIKPSWLALTKPSLLHVVTGAYKSQKLAEDSQLSLASWSVDKPADHLFEVLYADQVGAVMYTLTPDDTD